MDPVKLFNKELRKQRVSTIVDVLLNDATATLAGKMLKGYQEKTFSIDAVLGI